MTALAVSRSFSDLVPRRFLPGPRGAWTCVGALAIPLWATWPALAKATQGLPAFQLMTVAYAVAALLLWARPRFGSAPKREQAGWLATVVTVFGSLGSSVTLALAVRYMPPAPAQLVSYLWPVIVVAFAGVLGLASVGRWQVAGIALGLTGAALVIGTDAAALSPTGVGYALLSALTWAVFCVFRMWEGAAARDALKTGFTAAAGVALMLHLAFESTVWPTAGTLAGAIAVGVVPLTLGGLAWDHGVRRGDARLLAVMAFATPLVSTVLLILLGWAEPSAGLFIGGLAIVAAGVMSARN